MVRELVFVSQPKCEFNAKIVVSISSVSVSHGGEQLATALRVIDELLKRTYVGKRWFTCQGRFPVKIASSKNFIPIRSARVPELTSD